MFFNKFIPAVVLCITTALAGQACAYNLPPEFVSLNDNHLLSHLPTTTPPQSSIKTKLLTQYSGWKGTRYHFGGHTHRGIDCSALMQEIFEGSMSMELPRTTREQIRNGHHITQDELKPGDLVFFKTSAIARHVGVYVGDNQFIHASKKKGVTVSSLTNNYWRAHYETARRITTAA